MRTLLFAAAAMLLACLPAHACFVGTPDVHCGGGNMRAEIAFSGGGWRSGAHRLVAISSRDLGRNPTGQRYLWCQDWINHLLRKAGYRGTGSRLAKSSLRLGRRASSPRPGDIAVYNRRGGGHVGIVVKVQGGKVLLRSGNACGPRGRRSVCDTWRSKSAAIAYRRL